ncbi:hypothetical protein HZU77_005000 [Neisseriaceae bacterium TC5R-5]|nr:hypothetical protein [Neisseriaceae bacterium TC5R-5]
MHKLVNFNIFKVFTFCHAQWLMGRVLFLIMLTLGGSAKAAVEVIVLDMPGFAANNKGWMADLLHSISVFGQPLRLNLQPVVRATSSFYQAGKGDVYAADVLCLQPHVHYLTVGLRDYEGFVVRKGKPIPDRLALPPKGSTILVVRGFDHDFVPKHLEYHWKEASSIPQALTMLRVGRVDYLYTYLELAEDAISQQHLASEFDYSIKHTVADIVPALVFRSTPRGLLLAQQMRKQLLKLTATGIYAKIMASNGLPSWHFRDGVSGIFKIVKESDCKP